MTYLFRPYLPPGCPPASVGCAAAGAGGPLPLSGFGVSMALKNMEYKAIDDSKVAAGKEAAAQAGGAQGDGDFGTEEVQGFLFGRLVERRPELKAELLMCALTIPFLSGESRPGNIFALSRESIAAVCERVLDAPRSPLRRRFRDTLLSAAMEEGEKLEVWEMKDLGLQATQRIAASVRR